MMLGRRYDKLFFGKKPGTFALQKDIGKIFLIYLYLISTLRFITFIFGNQIIQKFLEEAAAFISFV